MHYGVAMRNHGKIIPELSNVRTTVTLSKPARKRLRWMEFYESHGHNARLACRHFSLSPDVFYRWKNRYNPRNLANLEDDPSTRKPRQVRQPMTDPQTVTRIKQLREQYPRWGKKKVHAILCNEGFSVSEPTVDRTLARLRLKGQPPVVTARLADAKRRNIARRPYTKRRDWSFVPKAASELAQVDTSHGCPARDGHQCQYHTGCYAMEQRWPVRLKAIQVDGGSEFMAVFETACKDRGITLYVLPPHSPKLNGVVERMNRTSREEIYDLGMHHLLTIAEHNQLLKEQDDIYNRIRPHEALGLQAPFTYHKSMKH